jgi:hypothetical protein
MNRSVRWCALLASIPGIAGSMLGQSSATLNDPAKAPCMEAFGDQMSYYTVGKPFVATYSMTTIRTIPDSTDLPQMVSLIKMARDSSGKFYVASQTWPKNAVSGIPYRSFMVNDPVSGAGFGWSQEGKVVFVDHSPGINSPEMQERMRKWPWANKIWAVPLCGTNGLDPDIESREFSIQNIGTGRILGIDAQGILATRNDALTEERWFSSDLQIALTTRVTDPQFGTSILELKSLERIEPEPGLFRIPAGYAIKDIALPHEVNR